MAYTPPATSISISAPGVDALDGGNSGGVPINTYSYSPNGSGGVNYFENGSPITNTAYGKATGVNYGQLESYVANQFANSGSGSTSGSTGGSGSSSGTTTDPNAVAYYSDLINQLTSQLNGAQGELPTVEGNVQSAYDTALNQENQSESNAESQIKTELGSNATQRESNIGQINSNANSSYNALMQLLGANGAAVSSAATTGVPYAVAQNASSQRQGADTTFNTNETAIDTADTTQKQQYQNALQDLLTQRNTNMGNAESSILQQEGSLEQQIAAAQINRAEYGGESYAAAAKGAGNTTAAATNIQDQLNSIFKQYATPDITPTPVTVTTPNTTTYSVDPTVAKAATANPTTDTSFLPYLQNIQQPNILTGANTTPAPTPAATGAAA